MDLASRSSLPIGLAVRLTLDSTSYSNILPEWFEPLTVDYRQRESRLQTTIKEYLNGALPATAFEISVPKKSGGTQVWVIPSVNDQIVCQAAVSSIGKALQHACVDTTKVFSCLLNRDPNRLSFLEDQVAAWKRFQLTIAQQCKSDQCILQLDLKSTFDSIRMEPFLDFIKSRVGDSNGVQLFVYLLNAFANGRPGLPFINDSVFFLGNAFLQRADQIVSEDTNTFVRFADDYKIFGTSRADLEKLFSKLREKLKAVGFDVNDSKVKLGTGEEFLEAVSKLEYYEPENGDYIDTAVHPDVFDPKDMHSLILACIRDPDKYLTQGFGRLQLAAIRRMRVRALYSMAQSYPKTPRDEFADLLAEDLEATRRVCELLEKYSEDDTNIWRLLWLLYLSKDLAERDIDDKTIAKRLSSAIQGINQSRQLSLVSRLWAASMPDFPSAKSWEADIETLHSLGYVERGKRCYGG